MAYNRSAIFGRRSRSAVTTLRAPPSNLTHSTPGAVVSPGIFSLRRYPPDDSFRSPHQQESRRSQVRGWTLNLQRRTSCLSHTIDYTSSLNDVVVEFSLLIKTIVTVEPVGILPSPPAFCFMTCGTITFCSLHSPQRRRPYCCSRVCTYTGAFPLAPTPVGSLGSFMQVHKGSKIAVIAPLCLAAVEK